MLQYKINLFSRLFIFTFCFHVLFHGNLFSRTAELDCARTIYSMSMDVSTEMYFHELLAHLSQRLIGELIVY